MTAGSDKEDDVILAGEYALGLLSGGAAEAFEARLAVEPELRALYASWAEDFAAMVDKVPEQAPRPEVREQIEAALFGRAVGRTPGRAPGVWARIGLGRGLAVLAVAAVLAAVVFGSGLLERGPVPPVAPTQRAEIAAEDGALVIAAAFERTTGRLYLSRSVGEARPGRALELWLIEGQGAVVSLGLLPDAREGEMIIGTALRARMSGAVLAVSDEPAGGSPTGAPTGAVLATGAVSDV